MKIKLLQRRPWSSISTLNKVQKIRVIAECSENTAESFVMIIYERIYFSFFA